MSRQNGKSLADSVEATLVNLFLAFPLEEIDCWERDTCGWTNENEN